MPIAHMRAAMATPTGMITLALAPETLPLPLAAAVDCFERTEPQYHKATT